MLRRLSITLVPVLAACAVFAATVGSSAAPSPVPKFGAPVKVTPDGGGGYEPAVYADEHGNWFATAHKLVTQLPLAPDERAANGLRSMSWAWMSSDNGRTWRNLPGLPVDMEKHMFGDEGDMAIDDAGHLYFVDTTLPDVTFTRWTIKGRGDVALDTFRPLLPSSEPLDDRPWITAHGDGVVLYLGNNGGSWVGIGRDGNGNGPGRFTVYRSTDGGETFDNVGYSLEGSGWCRPAADHTPGSKYFYVLCNDLDDTLYAYVSDDDGVSFDRFVIGKYTSTPQSDDWPTALVAPDGSIWMLYTDAGELRGNDSETNKVVLFHSTDHGHHWTRQDITGAAGRYRYDWLSMSQDGKRLGMGIYFKPRDADVYHVYGAVWVPGEQPEYVSVDPAHPVSPAGSEPPHDLMGSAFGADGSFGVMWTRIVTGTDDDDLAYKDIYFARATAPPTVLGKHKARSKSKPVLPKTGGEDAFPIIGLVILAATTARSARVRRPS